LRRAPHPTQGQHAPGQTAGPCAPRPRTTHRPGWTRARAGVANTPEQKAAVLACVDELAALGAGEEYTREPTLCGNWQLAYTTEKVPPARLQGGASMAPATGGTARQVGWPVKEGEKPSQVRGFAMATPINQRDVRASHKKRIYPVTRCIGFHKWPATLWRADRPSWGEGVRVFLSSGTN